MEDPTGTTPEPSTMIFPEDQVPTAVTLTQLDSTDSSTLFVWGLMGIVMAGTAVTLTRKHR